MSDCSIILVNEEDLQKVEGTCKIKFAGDQVFENNGVATTSPDGMKFYLETLVEDQSHVYEISVDLFFQEEDNEVRCLDYMTSKDHYITCMYCLDERFVAVGYRMENASQIGLVNIFDTLNK